MQGAAVSWPPYVGGAGGYGHVAFVEKVLDGGKKFILVNIIGMYLMDMEKRTIDVLPQMTFIYDKKNK